MERKRKHHAVDWQDLADIEQADLEVAGAEIVRWGTLRRRPGV